MDPKEIAKILLKLNAVTLRPSEPFTYTSGLKGPIYCDNRLIMSHPVERKVVIDSFLQKIEEARLEFDVVAGTATAGIPHAAWIAYKLDKPMVYVRVKKKEHGKENKIEGKLESRQKVLLIEDLVTTGGSSLGAVEVLREAGAEVVACVAIFTYGFEKSHQKFEEAECPLLTLTDLKTLVDVALETDYIDDADKDSIMEWHKDPETWGAK